MATDVTGAGLAHLAYDLSWRALERQEQMIDELRARTGVLVASSALAASFLGGRAGDQGWGILSVSALTAFILSIFASLWVLLPREGLVFSVRGTVVLESEGGHAGPLDETYRRLTYWIEGFRDANQPTINRMSKLYRVATVAVASQVLLWVFEIIW